MTLPINAPKQINWFKILTIMVVIKIGSLLILYVKEFQVSKTCFQLKAHSWRKLMCLAQVISKQSYQNYSWYGIWWNNGEINLL